MTKLLRILAPFFISSFYLQAQPTLQNRYNPLPALDETLTAWRHPKTPQEEKQALKKLCALCATTDGATLELLSATLKNVKSIPESKNKKVLSALCAPEADAKARTAKLSVLLSKAFKHKKNDSIELLLAKGARTTNIPKIKCEKLLENALTKFQASLDGKQRRKNGLIVSALFRDFQNFSDYTTESELIGGLKIAEKVLTFASAYCTFAPEQMLAKGNRHSFFSAAATYNFPKIFLYVSIKEYSAADLGAEGPKLLYRAAELGNDKVVDELLSMGVRSDGIAGLHGTALHAAAFHGHYQTAENLRLGTLNELHGKEENFTPMYPNKHGITPVELARKQKHHAVAGLLDEDRHMRNSME